MMIEFFDTGYESKDPSDKMEVFKKVGYDTYIYYIHPGLRNVRSMDPESKGSKAASSGSIARARGERGRERIPGQTFHYGRTCCNQAPTGICMFSDWHIHQATRLTLA